MTRHGLSSSHDKAPESNIVDINTSAQHSKANPTRNQQQKQHSRGQHPLKIASRRATREKDQPLDNQNPKWKAQQSKSRENHFRYKQSPKES